MCLDDVMSTELVSRPPVASRALSLKNRTIHPSIERAAFGAPIYRRISEPSSRGRTILSPSPAFADAGCGGYNIIRQRRSKRGEEVRWPLLPYFSVKVAFRCIKIIFIHLVRDGTK